MSGAKTIEIQQCPVDKILDLRWRILRAGHPRDTANFDGDREPASIHFAALQNGQLVGCASIVQRPWQDKAAWQLRGMAVEQAMQGAGVGRLLLAAVDAAVLQSQHSRQLWCNARTPAVAFYEKLGWKTFGAEFVVRTAGPHFQMTKHL